MDIKNTPKKPIFTCEICSFLSGNKKDYTRHLMTAKHKNNINDTKIQNLPIKNPSPEYTVCHCGKEYKYHSGLWRHKQTCSQQTTIQSVEPVLENTFTSINDIQVMPAFDMNLVLELLKQNQEFKDMIIDQNEQILEISKQQQSQHIEQNKNIMELAGKVGNTTNNISNNQNNNFNLNVFLNETCKDAVCINDFIKDLPVSFQQLENIGQNGYVAGITEVIISYLKTMEVSERPLHCTDTKRDIMYIKEMNKWVKDDDNNTKMTRIFRTIANKNLRTIRKWAEEHPLSQESNTKENSFCTDVMLNSLGAIGDDQIKYDNKVLKAIAKFVHVGRN